jgi:hypothetical protein
VSLNGHGEVSLGFITGLAAAAIFGPCFGALTAGGASLIVDLLARPSKGTAKIAFNAGQLTLVGGLTGLAFKLLAVDGAGDLAVNAVAYTCAALVFVAANGALTSVVFALLGQQFVRVWMRLMRDAGIFYLAMAPLGALLASAYVQSPWTLLYFPLLAWVIYRGFGLYAKLRSETQNALVALANSLERRDPYTYQHSARVATTRAGSRCAWASPRSTSTSSSPRRTSTTSARSRSTTVSSSRKGPSRRTNAARSTNTPLPAPSLPSSSACTATAPRSSAAITSAGTEPATRLAWLARRSRWGRASSPSQTSTTQ